MNWYMNVEKNNIGVKTGRHVRKALLAGLYMLVCTSGMIAQTQEQLLLSGWRFQRGSVQGAESAQFDDSGWQQVTIPHDWAITGPFDTNMKKTGSTGALPWTGEGWYRTQMNIPEGYSSAELIFDGAMAEPHVYIDGNEVGYWAYGYNTFSLDISRFLPQDNGDLVPGTHTLAVHLYNIEESARWYPGAGLYRPVRLVLHPDSYLKTWGTFARTTMVTGVSADASSASEARIYVSSEVKSGRIPFGNNKFQVRQSLLDNTGSIVAQSIENVNLVGMGLTGETKHVLSVQDAHLWSPEKPYLYTLVTEFVMKDKLFDRKETKVGIRSIEYTADGFRLNGQVRKFKGVCLHHDLGPLGAAFNKDAFGRQVRLLKEMGCDAIRTAHNMPAPWQMDICDEMGMLVMAESFDMWISPKVKNGYCRFFDQRETPDSDPWWKRDLTNLVLVNRNHPSIVMWSIGNEVPEQGSVQGREYTRLMQDLVHDLDGTRPCTQGMDQGTASMRIGNWQECDIPGFNYRLHVYHEGYQNSPKGIILGTETASTISSRGEYKFPVQEEHGKAYSDGQISSYDLESCIWSNLPDDDWMYQDKLPWVIGEFVWTGFDYLGEPTPYDGSGQSRSSYFGIYDLAGLPKDRMWLYRTHWAPEKETLHLLPHWTWPGREGETTPVFCYTSYPEAELFVNGKSQGRLSHSDMTLEEYEDHRIQAPMPWGGTSTYADPAAGKNRLDRYRMRWMNVKYEPGELKVVAYDADGNKVAEEVVRTAGRPDHIELVADRSEMPVLPTDSEGNALDCPSLTFVTARIVDKAGNLCPDSDLQLSFSVKGKSAVFNSCCNGDATSTEIFTEPTMKAFHGQLVIVLQSTDQPGLSTLTVTGKGLKSARISVSAKI